MYKLSKKNKYIPNSSNSSQTGATVMTQLNLTTTTTPGLAQLIGLFRNFGFSGIKHRLNRPGDVNPNDPVEALPGERLDCGGYNEAFIMQHWASYNLR